MKAKYLNLFGLVVVALVATANDWENPEVNSRNRLPARTYTMPLADEAQAFTDELEPSTPYKLSLNGDWKIKWVGDPARRPVDFWKTDFDDSAWGVIDVPSCVEMRGYGTPGYTNIRYPHKYEWPKILDRDRGTPDYNPVSSYRRTFVVPKEWKGREVILRFDGVYSAYYVWVNGEQVGYAEDSKLPSEFNITKVLNDGVNTLAVQVFRWCDGSYLEDQDMFRFSGIFRDVTLWSMPKDGIWDFTVRTKLLNDYTDAELSVDGFDGEVALFDGDKHPVKNFKGGEKITVENVKLWSAEKPDLYTLVLKKGGDIRMKRIGFKEQKIVGNTILVNGKPIKFKGVNRHETNPDNGRTVSLEDMLKDITLFKQYNINTVRTCHYPDHHLWYDLCDRYGIYVVAEANVEGHEPGYGDKGLGRFKEWEHTIVERNQRHVEFYRNNVSVTLWSLGNETGHGDCFRAARDAVRTADGTRPIHWERGNEDVDVDSRMYPSVEWLEQRGQYGDEAADMSPVPEKYKDMPKDHQSPGKAFFMCEYAHAMGNAIGNFQEYWDVFYRYPSLSGGCIWDWVDQAVWKYTDRVNTKTGERDRYLAYGGDFDEEPNDGPFCDNGVVDPFRNVSAKLVEVAHVHRNLVVRRNNDDKFTLENRFGFTNANEFKGDWEVIADGVRIAGGELGVPSIVPLSTKEIELPRLKMAMDSAKPSAELFVNFAFSLRQDTEWAKKGWVVARDQIKLREPKTDDAATKSNTSRVVIRRLEDKIVARGGKTEAEFSIASGLLTKLVINGMTVISNPADGIIAGPKLTCMRAFTDNDIWMTRNRAQTCEAAGLTQLTYHSDGFSIEGNVLRSRVSVDGAKGVGFIHESEWTFVNDGSVTVKNKIIPFGQMPPAIPRLGFSLMINPMFEKMTWYGRGPSENYVDRKTGSFIGVWNSTVKEQYEDYVRPQDCGMKCDVRWVEFRNDWGNGVRISSSEPFFMQALHYGWEDLEFARHRNRQRRMRMPLCERREVMLNLDVRQTGLGGASCGPVPMDKYRFDPNETVEWTFKIERAGK